MTKTNKLIKRSFTLKPELFDYLNECQKTWNIQGLSLDNSKTLARLIEKHRDLTQVSLVEQSGEVSCH